MSFGRLERTRAPEPMSQINVTPLVDVMLVLVVIFIVTAPLLASSLRLDLPASDAAVTSTGEPVPGVQLSLDRSGQVFLDDQPISMGELAQRLERVALARPDAEVQLRADENVPYGKVVEVMGLAQKAGLGRIGFVAEAPDTLPDPRK